MNKIIMSLVFLFISTISFGQVGIGTTVPNNSAVLDVVSTNKGFLMPRMSTIERTAISTSFSTDGLQVYDLTTHSVWYYKHSITDWVELSGSTGTDNQKVDSFTLTGNTLKLSIEDDGEADKAVDLAGYLDNTDTQNLSIDASGHVISLVAGGSVTITDNVDDADASTTNELITSGTLSGTDLEIVDAGGTTTVDLSSLDDSGTDNQKVDTFTLTGNTLKLSIEDDGEADKTVDLSSIAVSHTGTEGSIFFAKSDGTPTENNGQLFWDNTNKRLGLGTNSPSHKFQIIGQLRASSISNANGTANAPAYRFNSDSNTGMFRATTDELGFSTGGNEAIRILANGNVGIGTTAPVEKLHVNGKIRTAISIYADYVFEEYYDGYSKIKEDYTFKSLSEVDKFIKTNKHLPGITSIIDIPRTEEGLYSINITDLTVQLLEKVEELYLHTIEQEKKISYQKEKINKLIIEKNKQILDLSKRLEKLEKLLK